MAGTISIIPSALGSVSEVVSSFIGSNPNSSGYYNSATLGTTGAELLAGLLANTLSWETIGPPKSAQISFIFDQGSNIFSLDEASRISFNDLPNGLLIDSLFFSLICSPQIYATPGDVFVGGALALNSAGVYTKTLISTINTSISPLTAIGNNLIMNISSDAGGGPGFIFGAFYAFLQFNGTYKIFAFSWGIKNGTTPKRIVRSNLQPLKVTVESPGDPDTGGPTGVETGGLDGIVIDDGTGISSIVISYYTPSGILKQRAIATEDIIVQENIIFIFIINIILLQFFLDDLDIAINNTTFYLSATGNGIQFSGTVPLGTLNILLVDASGMYKVVSGKRNDTLYDGHDGDTFDSAIPNPFIKGGFIGG